MTIEQVRGTIGGATDMGTVAGWGAVPELTEDAAARIAGAVSASQSAGTRRVYASDWRRFRAWCERSGHASLPAHPVTVAAYLVEAADTLTGVGSGPTRRRR